MAKVKIYGVPASRAFRALWAAEELGIGYENIQIDFGDTGNWSPEYRAINPNARLPTLVDAGYVLWESLAITMYLCKKYGLGRLYPPDDDTEAVVWQWSFFAATQLEPYLRAWKIDVDLPPEEEWPHDRFQTDMITIVARALTVLDEALATKPYLLGKDFSAADLNVAAILYNVRDRDYAAMPNLADWLKRCTTRPAAVKARKMRDAPSPRPVALKPAAQKAAAPSAAAPGAAAQNAAPPVAADQNAAPRPAPPRSLPPPRPPR